MSSNNISPSYMTPFLDPLTGIVYEAFFEMAQSLAHKISKVPRPLGVDVLTMREVIRYFVEERPADPAIEHGALLIRRGFRSPGPAHRRVTLCFQVFLDADHALRQSPDGEIYGRAMVVGLFDPELKGYLEGQDLVIFE
jgi:hypothetical protein